MFCAIGNSPSSGSTLLADLLDATPHGVCGDELGIFSNAEFYENFDKFKRDPFLHSHSSTLYNAENFTNVKNLHSYALNKSSFSDIVSDSLSQGDFVSKFSSYYRSLRGKPSATWFEKTPENICMLARYRRLFPDNYFIHIVRNPLYVAYSLCKNRGLPLGIALNAWMFDVVHVYPYLNDSQVIQVSYEDLVHDPWSVIAGLLSKISGSSMTSHQVEESYKNNFYRELSSVRLKSWSVNAYGVVSNANKKEIEPEFVYKFNQALDNRISSKWSSKYGVQSISYKDLIRAFGYHHLLNDDCLLPEQRRHSLGLNDYLLLLKFRIKNIQSSVLPRKSLKPIG